MFLILVCCDMKCVGERERFEVENAKKLVKIDVGKIEKSTNKQKGERKYGKLKSKLGN